LLHHITIDLLKRSYLSLERDSAPGIDGVTWQTYGENLEEKLEDPHDKVHRGSYRARPARRTYVPKADDSKRGAAGSGRPYRDHSQTPDGAMSWVLSAVSMPAGRDRRKPT
jgi:hypothetical protein